MKLFKGARAFKDDESGAVTVDWVVLTAAIVGLGIAIIATVKLASPKPAHARFDTRLRLILS
jgi:Flp pilus assembly pilin Flp